MNKYQLLTTDNELIFEVVKAWQDDIKKLLNDNTKAETLMTLANDWGYII
ncbi:hypothetical protein LMHOCYYV_CDS0002 [Staphylococcus phage PG-2021_4]